MFTFHNCPKTKFAYRVLSGLFFLFFLASFAEARSPEITECSESGTCDGGGGSGGGGGSDPNFTLSGVVNDDIGPCGDVTVLAIETTAPSGGGGGKTPRFDISEYPLLEFFFGEATAWAASPFFKVASTGETGTYSLSLPKYKWYHLYLFKGGYISINAGKLYLDRNVSGRNYTLQPLTAVNDYTLDGMVRADLNEAPNPPTGPGIAGVNMIFEWDMGVGHQKCQELGWQCCDGVLQSNLEEFQATTFADGSFSRTALTPTHTYCITLTKPGFYNETYYWDAQGTSGTTTFLIQEPFQNPSFTAPPLAQTSSSAPVGLPMDLRFRATDPNIDRVTFLTVLGTLPPGTSVSNITNPGNTPTQQAEISISGTPTTLGDYPFTLRAQDAWGNLISRNYTLQILPATVFLDVSSNLLSNPSTLTAGADVGDIDGDGDKDLVISHFAFGSDGTRIWINDNGLGRFRDGTADPPGRLPAAFRSRGVRLALQNPGLPPGGGNNLDLFLTHWYRFGTGTVYEDAGHSNEFSYLSYRLRLQNNGSGFFTPYSDVTKDLGCNQHLITPGPVNTAYAADIEVGELQPGYLHALYANVAKGEVLPDSDIDPDANEEQFVYFVHGSHLFWKFDGTEDGMHLANFQMVRDDCPFGLYWCYEAPRGSDFELADVDGDGKIDVFSGGVAFGGDPFPDPANPAANDYNYLPRIFRNAGGAWFDQVSNLTGAALTLPTGDNFVAQKGAFGDLDNDGDPDLAIVDVQQGLRILRNDSTPGSISFVLVSTNPAGIVPDDAREVVIGNIVGDGLPDIVLIGNGARREKVLRNNGGFNFSDATGTTLPDVADNSTCGLLFDMDSDGDLDLFICNDGPDRLYKNFTIP